jgi:glycosyltransferase involved in cell wall biosynthesis
MTAWALASGDFTPLGGMDRANHALAAHLAASGRDVHLVAHRVSSDLAALPHVTVHHAPRPLGSHLLGAPLLSREATAVARRIGADASFLSNGGNTRWQAPTWIHYLHAAYAPEAAGARARLTARAGRRRFLRDEARTIARAAVVICNSERTAADVRRHYSLPAARVRVVYYGTDAADFGEVTAPERAEARDGWLNNERPLAIFIGALGDRRKGFDALFEAWCELCRDAAWDVDLAVAGAGAEAPAWQTRASAAGLAQRLRFLGFRADVPRVMAAADVIVHPSRYEAYGLAVHEALCRGIPAIVARSAGVAERLPADLQPLTLPDPISARVLVERLRLWRTDRAAWQTRARAFGADLRTRSWQDMAREIAAIVEQAR